MVQDMYYGCINRPTSQPDEDHSKREVDMLVVKNNLKADKGDAFLLIQDFASPIDMGNLVQDVLFTNTLEASDYAEIGERFARIIQRSVEKYGAHHG